MKEIIKRFSAESPSFFKKIQALGLTLGGVGGVIMSLPELAPTVQLPEIIVKLAGYFVVAGLVSAAIAKTTVKDTSVLEKDEVK